jgi:hypothetical protein
MKIALIFKKGFSLIVASIALSLLISCQPDEPSVGNGLSDPNADATFTIAPVTGAVNKYTLTSQTIDVIGGSKWDIGEGYFEGKLTETVYFPDAGTYTINHKVLGRGGVLSAAKSQVLIVPTTDPNGGNLVAGGKFANPTDWAKWVKTTTSTSATIVYGDKYALLKASGWAGQGIYQKISVVAGKKYKIDLSTSSTTGCQDTWFEVYCGYKVPVDGQDYNDGGMLRSINTWDGCGKVPFAGKISAIGCKPDNNKGIFTATSTGDVYLLIRGGGADMKDGIKMTNIEMRLSL